MSLNQTNPKALSQRAACAIPHAEPEGAGEALGLCGMPINDTGGSELPAITAAGPERTGDFAL